jgi:hypothetical protein
MHRLMAAARMVRIWNGDVQFNAKPIFSQSPGAEQIENISRMLPFWWQRLKIEQASSIWKALVHYVNSGRVYGSVLWSEDRRHPHRFSREHLLERLEAFATELPDRLSPAEMPQDSEELMALFAIDELRTHPLNLQFDEDRQEFYVNGAEARAEFIDGFRVFEDMSTPEWPDKWWVIVDYLLPVTTIKERYGPAANHVKGERGAIELFGDTLGPDPPAAVEGGIMESSHVYVLWHRATDPTGPYPKGVRADVCEDRVVQGPHENAYRKLPVFEIICDPDPWGNAPDGSDPRGSSVMSDIRALNVTLNTLAEQIARHTAHAVEPDMLVPRDCVDSDFMTVHPGPQFWDPAVAQGAKPEPLQLPRLPEAASQMYFATVGMIERLASTNAPSQGVPSSQAKSGVAIKALQGADDLMQEMPVDGWRLGLAEMGKRIVEVIVRFSPEGQVQRGLHDGKPILLNALDNRLFTGRPNGELDAVFDIDVTIGQKHSEQSIVERAAVMQRLGWLDPMVHRSLIFQALRTGDATLLDPTRRDRARIAREHEVISALSDLLTEKRISPESLQELWRVHVRVRLGDNPTIHVDGHLDYIVENEEKLHPLVIDLLITHVEQHGRISMAGMGMGPGLQGPGLQGPGDQPGAASQLQRPASPRPQTIGQAAPGAARAA